MRYAVRRLNPLSALLFGLLLGLAAWVVPGIALGWLVRTAVQNFQQWLGSLQLTIPLALGEGITLDLSALPQLAETQTRLAALSGRGGALVLAVALGVAAAGMLFTGLAAFTGSLVYNLFARVLGGVEVTLDPLAEPPAQPLTATVAPSPRAVARPAPATTTPRAAAPSAWLSPAGNGSERLALNNEITRIGSAPDNDIIVAGLAPQHAEIRRESGRYLIYDLGSRRTWVNDNQVAAVHMLKDGFRLQLGQTDFVVRIPTP